MFPSQTNTQSGNRRFNSGVSLIGLEGRLVMLTVLEALLLPAALTDVCLFVVLDGGAINTDSEVMPLVPGQETRIRSNGVAAAGDIAVLEVIAGANIGKIRTLPATPGVYFSPGSYAEAAVDEQLAKINPLPRIVVVADSVAAPAAVTSTNGVAGAAGADLPGLAAEAEKIGDDARVALAAVADLRLKLITAGVITA